MKSKALSNSGADISECSDNSAEIICSNIIKVDFAAFCPRIKKRGRPRKVQVSVDNVVRPPRFEVRHCEIEENFSLAALILIGMARDAGLFKSHAEHVAYYALARCRGFSQRDLDIMKNNFPELGLI